MRLSLPDAAKAPDHAGNNSDDAADDDDGDDVDDDGVDDVDYVVYGSGMVRMVMILMNICFESAVYNFQMF